MGGAVFRFKSGDCLMRLPAYTLSAACLAAALAAAGAARALEAHADANAPTQPAACKLALALAGQDVPSNRRRASHCECLEDKDNHENPWSCTAFVDYR